MTNLAQIFGEYNQVTVRWNEDPTFPVWVASDIGKALDIGNISQTLSRFEEDEKEKINIIDTVGRKQEMAGVTERGLKRLISKSRKPQARELATYIGLDCYFSPIEVDCLRIIESALQHFNPVQQFRISGYIVDLYFPEQRIAIECDEDGHSNYNNKKEITRQDQITKLLGCQFIRFNPNEEGFNIGNVINKIILMVY